MMKRETTQSHWIRRILISIAALFTVIAVLVIVGLSVMNSEWGLEFVESKLTESVGQQVTINSRTTRKGLRRKSLLGLKPLPGIGGDPRHGY